MRLKIDFATKTVINCAMGTRGLKLSPIGYRALFSSQTLKSFHDFFEFDLNFCLAYLSSSMSKHWSYINRNRNMPPRPTQNSSGSKTHRKNPYR